jgi:hypothetical protein
MNTALVVASLISAGTGFSVPKNSALNSPRLSRQIDRSARSPTFFSSTITANDELLPGIEAIDAANDQVSEQLSGLRHTPYFCLYSVDILASCEYMPQELFECYSQTCEVYPVDDEEVSFVSQFAESVEQERLLTLSENMTKGSRSNSINRL